MSLTLIIFLGLALVHAKAATITECQKLAALYSGPDTIDVRCLPNGDYAPFQCMARSGLCYCSTADGRRLTKLSKVRKHCECEIQKAEILDNLKLDKYPNSPMIELPYGLWVPSCSEDGHYDLKQCEVGSGVCWCADPKDGSETTERGTGIIECT